MALSCTLQSLTGLDASDPAAVDALMKTCLAALLSPQMLMALIAFTLVCAAVGALIGRAKGRMLYGTILGALFGPIGWAIVGFGPVQGPPCGECGVANPPHAKTCRSCGADLAAASARTARSRMRGSAR